jgi:4-hydroxy-3-methylbut-2-enyl diphosphate reductase
LVALGYLPVVIGKRGHVEVNGLVGDFPSAIVVQNEADVAALPRDHRLGVISQTTQPIERVLDLVAAIRSAQPGREVRFADTVCQPTKNRQTALKQLISECDTIVVVGGRNSNNTLQLVHAAESSGVRVVHIERADELRAECLRQSRVVGLTAGTSTLKETVAEVHAELVRIAEQFSPPSGANMRNESPSSDQTAAWR